MNIPLPSFQQSLPGLCDISTAIERMSQAGAEERGAIFTRSEVVDFILDLVGYTEDAPLHTMRLLEPSAGDGDFLFRAIDRLLASAAKADCPISDLGDQVRVVELHHDTCEGTRAKVIRTLLKYETTPEVARRLANTWIRQGDFLLQDFGHTFTHVVGNPPYVRQELIPDALLNEYRRRYATLYDRADLYVPFIERSLSLLAPNGALGFICADRWMKNKYGGPLRELIASRFHLKHYVDMVDTPAFHSDVIAYPAVTVIANAPPGPTRVVQRPTIDAPALAALSAAMTARVADHPAVLQVDGVAAGREPWVLEQFDRLRLVRRLEAALPSLEDAGCKVGIGVATGADNAFIGSYDDLDVEPARKLPLAMRSDLNQGVVAWRGNGIVNPFLPNGMMADLDAFPRFGEYIRARQHLIDKRHVAKKNPRSWYRTIDRIYPELAQKPKLLIPDIAGEADVVFENEGLYPHHNLYYVISETWDLEALRAIMISGVAKLFVATYSTKMRGGYLRFQAQYLRRIRVPHWSDVSLEMRTALIDASRRNDISKCNDVVAQLYGLSAEEQQFLAKA